MADSGNYNIYIDKMTKKSPYSIQIDETLTKPGFAADAASVGYALEAIGGINQENFIVEYNTNDGINFTTETTYEEIAKALLKNMLIIAKVNFNNKQINSNINKISNDVAMFDFGTAVFDKSYCSQWIKHTSNDEITGLIKNN